MKRDQGTDRHRRGVFYTPPEITTDLVKRSIDARLLHLLGDPPSGAPSTLEDLLRTGSSDDLRALDRLSRQITVLDPACGEGAFLVPALEHIVNIRSGCMDPAPDEGVLYTEVLETNIFGVDLQEEALEGCRRNLLLTAGIEDAGTNLRLGHALLGHVGKTEGDTDPTEKFLEQVTRLADRATASGLEGTPLLHWNVEFPVPMDRGGFDVIVGNPPYGNRALRGPERAAVRELYSTARTDDRGKGSLNPSALFLERCLDLLVEDGRLALVLPSSLTRVREFQKIRRMVLERAPPWEIVNEGSPFEGVTLEMISLLARKTPLSSWAGGSGDPEVPGPSRDGPAVRVRSRRPPIRSNGERTGTGTERRVPLERFERYDRFMLYWDEDIDVLMEGSRTGVLNGRRGPTLPSEERSVKRDRTHTIPLLLSGRSVRRYRLVPGKFHWLDPDCLDRGNNRRIHDSRMVVATRLTDRYRACIKPPGMMVGDNVIRLGLDGLDIPHEALCVILNSTLMELVVRKYLLNNAELTFFIQSVTGATPIAAPSSPAPFEEVGGMMHRVAQGRSGGDRLMERLDHEIADPLVYELYLCGQRTPFAEGLEALLEGHTAGPPASPENLLDLAGSDDELVRARRRIMEDPTVKRIEAALGR